MNNLKKSFYVTEDIIQKNPGNENEIISEYTKYIINSRENQYSGYKPFVRSATYSDSELPIDINIHNNFQRYNNTPEITTIDNNNNPNYDNYNMIPEYKYQPNNYYPINNSDSPILFSYNPATPVVPAPATPVAPVPVPDVPSTAAPVPDVPSTAAPVPVPDVPSTAAPVPVPDIPSTVAPVPDVPSTVAPVVQTFQDYFKDLREGFKDYYAFNN
jgi:hypothetical protein